jgi:hypothetical protein
MPQRGVRTDKKSRDAAREFIIQKANQFALKHQYPVVAGGFFMKRLLHPGQIQWAVYVCRQNHLVDDKTLALAGFRAKRRRR